MTSLTGKRVLLIIGGGIAAHKALEAARQLKRRGVRVRCIVTRAGLEFVTELAVAHLTGEKVYSDLFAVSDEVEMGHIELSRDADLLLVAPATADLIAKMANGLADDLATTALLATDKPVLIAPAMNVRMWHHAATQRNLARLAKDGIATVGPGEGEMACGEFGLGRLAEPDEIVAAVLRALGAVTAGPLSGTSALVTAGPTHEPIDPVRYIANRSSGRPGYAVAAALARAGARTTLVSGPTHLPAPPGVELIRVETARQMLEAAEAALPADIAVFAAAVADWRAAEEAGSKIKKRARKSSDLPLAENPDILASIAGGSRRPALVIGFAAETDAVVENAKKKRDAKGADWIVANDVSPETGVFGGARNRVHLITAGGVEDWPEMSKEDVAARLVERIVARLAHRAAAE